MPSDEINSAEMKARGYSPDAVAERQLIEELRELALPIIVEIERVFVSIPRPAITLHVAEGFDDEWFLTPTRASELAALDPEQTWEEVTDAAIEAHHSYFSFSNAEGWRFYLPAYMRYCLRTIPHGQDSVYWALLERNAGEKLVLLDQAQRAVVSRFVDFYRQHAG